MQEDRQQSIIDLQEIIYEAQPIKKIEELSIHSLNHFSQNFRLSYEHLEKEVNKHNDPKEVQAFHSDIVVLISKIQPSKGALAEVLDDVENMLAAYYPQDSKIQLRNAAKSKNIFVIDKLTPNQEKQLFIDIKVSIENIKRLLMLRESQLAMVIYIEDNAKKYPRGEFIKMYENYFDEIRQFVIPSDKCFCPINYFLLSEILKTEGSYYEQFGNKASDLKSEVQKCSKLLRNQEVIKSASKLAIEKGIKLLKILSSKISTIADLFSFACVKSQQDLFSKQKKHNRWKRLFDLQIVIYKLYAQSKIVNKSFDKLKANLNIINAAMSILNQNNETEGLKNFSKKWQSAGKVLQVALFKDNALHQAEVMISEPNEKLAKQIWNLPERAQFKKFIELGLPSIEFSKQFYIPRVANDYFYTQLRQDKAQLPNFKIDNICTYYNQLKVQSKDKVPIRINNYLKLILKQFKVEQAKTQTNIFRKTFAEMSKNFKNWRVKYKKQTDQSYKLKAERSDIPHPWGWIHKYELIHPPSLHKKLGEQPQSTDYLSGLWKST